MNGILSALRQHDGSIDELAKLPQNLIMQMAQRKEIGAEMVAPILARKAQMADAIARTKALQKGQAQGPAPTVMEQLMQKTADTEQPEPEEMGIASNPIPERNYAGGGIVAFAEAGAVEDKNLPERMPGESDNAYMRRVEAITGAGKQFFTPRNYNPLAKLSDLYNTYQENIGQPFAEGVKRFTSSDGTASFNKASEARKAIGAPSAAALPPMPTGVKADELGRTDAAKQGDKAPTTSPTGNKTVTTSPTGNKDTGLKSLTNKPNVGDAEPKTPSELQQVLAQYRSDIEGSKDEKDKARKEAMWSRLLEAGLNVMGGQSSNFAQNLALAGPAAKGFGEDIKGLRAEENTKRKQLAELGLKGYELNQAAKKAASEEEYMKQHGTYYDRAGRAALINASHAGDAAGVRKDMADQQLELKRAAAADKVLSTRLDYMRLSMSKKPEDLVKAAQIKNEVYAQYKVGMDNAAPTIGGYNPTAGQQAALSKYLPQ